MQAHGVSHMLHPLLIRRGEESHGSPHSHKIKRIELVNAGETCLCKTWPDMKHGPLCNCMLGARCCCRCSAARRRPMELVEGQKEETQNAQAQPRDPAWNGLRSPLEP